MLEHPITFTVAVRSPRRYQETIIDYVSGTTPTFDMTVCEVDDTYIKYTLGNAPEVTGDFFTFANILSDDELVIKQHGLTLGPNISFVCSGSTLGSHTSNVFFYDGIPIVLGGYQINTTITMNDGEFLEGTFNGEVFDENEESLGILDGSFRARIQ